MLNVQPFLAYLARFLYLFTNQSSFSTLPEVNKIVGVKNFNMLTIHKIQFCFVLCGGSSSDGLILPMCKKNIDVEVINCSCVLQYNTIQYNTIKLY